MNIIGNLGLVSLFFSTLLYGAGLELRLYNLHKKPVDTVVAGTPFFLHAFFDSTEMVVRNPVLEGLNHPSLRGITSGTRQQSINTQGQHIQESFFFWQLVIDTPGSYVLGPAHATMRQGTVYSAPLTVHVVAAPAVSLDQMYAERSSPHGMARLSVDKDHLLVGEMVTCSLQIYKAHPQTRLMLVDDPAASIAKQWKVVTDMHRSVTKERLKGVEYEVTTLTWSMCPTQSGLITIPAYTFMGETASHFSMGGFSLLFNHTADAQSTICSNARTITVDPLPPFDKKVDALGALTAYTAIVHPTAAYVGEGLILTLTLEGDADWSAVASPILQGLPQSLKWYESQQNMLEGTAPGIFRGKSFEYIVQGVEPGEWQIPAQSYTFFDVTTRSCRTLTTDPIIITILARPNGQGVQNKDNLQEQPVRTSADNSVHDTKGTDNLSDIASNEPWEPIEPWRMPWNLFFLLAMIPGSVLASRALYRWFQGYQAARSPANVRKKAFVRALRKVERAQQEDRPEHLYAIFMELYAERFVRDPASLHEESIETALRAHGFSEEQQHQWSLFFNAIARCAFGHEKSAETHENYFESAKHWVQVLEEKL